mmetsp:Transcript_46366/g.108868  ORF Transcript_46366/g.108868 Transcript_46366/m.108868 type:complete len:228 (+) Transcript_46366:460-1143(+)
MLAMSQPYFGGESSTGSAQIEARLGPRREIFAREGSISDCESCLRCTGGRTLLRSKRHFSPADVSLNLLDAKPIFESLSLNAFLSVNASAKFMHTCFRAEWVNMHCCSQRNTVLEAHMWLPTPRKRLSLQVEDWGYCLKNWTHLWAVSTSCGNRAPSDSWITSCRYSTASCGESWSWKRSISACPERKLIGLLVGLRSEARSRRFRKRFALLRKIRYALQQYFWKSR